MTAQMNCEVLLCSWRKTKDGIVAGFVIHPHEVPEALALAPIGTRFGMALVEITDKPAKEEKDSTATSPRPRSASPSTQGAGGAHPKKEWTQIPYSARAALRCKDATFRAFLRETNRRNAFSDEEAADYVREYCGVKSRSEIVSDSEAAYRWEVLDRSFIAWNYADSVVPADA